jgi:hypothetical protein
MSDSRAAANQEQRTKNSQNPNLTKTMKTKKILTLLISGVFATTMASQGAVIYTHTYTFDAASVDGGVFGSETHTYTQNFTNVGGTDVSFDLVLTAVAGDTAGTTFWSTGTRIGTDRVNQNESGTFSLSIANFNAGTSNYIEANVDFGLTLHRLSSDARGGTDQGTFTLINGVAPSSDLTWTDSNANIGEFDGKGFNFFDLELMNDTYGDGENVTSFTHLNPSSPNWSFFNQSIFYSLPEPSSTSLLGLGGLALMLRRKRSAA